MTAIRLTSVRGFLVVAGLHLLSLAALAAPITGRVLGPDGQPVAGADIVATIYGSPNPVAARTDAAGKYSVEVPPEATTSDYIGWVSVLSPGLDLGGATWRRKDLQNNTFDFRLQAAGKASGVVRDGDGKPVAGARVRMSFVSWEIVPGKPEKEGFRVPESHRDRFTTTTDAEGRWTLPAVVGKATVNVFLEDPAFVTTFVTGESGPGASPLIITARPGATVAGKVVYDDGRPAAGIAVTGQTANRQATVKGVSDANGAFRLTGLPNGIVTISAEDKLGAWVSIDVTGIETTEGQTTTAPDLLLSAGAMVQGTATDEATGAPLAGVTIAGAISNGSAFSKNSTSVSDAEGRYNLRVVPGKVTIYIQRVPRGYLDSMGDLNLSQNELTLAEGDTKVQDWKLRKGLTVTARVVDDKARPVGAVTVTLTRQINPHENWVNPATAETNAAGDWSAEGLAAGSWQVSVSDGWQVAAPSVVQLPIKGELRISLRKVTLASLSGRVLDERGRPISGATVEPRLTPPATPGADPNLSSYVEVKVSDAVVTDVNGKFLVNSIQPGSGIALTVSKPGHVYRSGGKVLNENGRYSVPDVVLAALSARIDGVVTDAAQLPVAGAQVFCPDGGAAALATTDAAGKFSLPALPRGEVLLIAVHADTAVTVRVRTGAPATLQLHPRVPLPGRNVTKAQEIITRAKVDALASADEDDPNGDWLTGSLAALLVVHSPEAALQAATDLRGNVSDYALYHLIDTLAKADPVRASIWAPDKISGIKQANVRIGVTEELATAIVGTDPDLARTLYAQLRQHVAEQAAAGDARQLQRNFSLYKLALPLRLPEAEQLRRDIVVALEKLQDKQEIENMADSMASVDTELTERLTARVAEDERSSRFQTIVPALTKRDMPAALRMLDRIEKLPRRDAEFQFAYAALPVISELGKTDPATALALARRVRSPQAMASALVRAARVQPKEQAVTLLQEAFKVAPQYPVYTSAQIAALAYDLDPAVGLKLFSQVKAKADVYNSTPSNAATWPFYHSRIDPAAARIELELEYARKKDAALQLGETQGLFAVAVAMAALDLDRALELYTLPASLGGRRASWSRSSALTGIVRYVLATTSQRYTLPFNPQSSVYLGDE